MTMLQEQARDAAARSPGRDGAQGRRREITPVDDFARLVADARLLLDHAVESGIAGADGRSVDPALILAVAEAERQLAAFGADPDAVLDPRARAAFEAAYRDLAAWSAPVTAATLRATSRAFGRRSALAFGGVLSQGQEWSRALMLWTLFFMAVVVVSEAAVRVGSAPGTFGAALSDMLRLLEPFAYGGLGACTFLLKSAHGFIRQRSFDPLRKPEYHSRILLGVIGGGTITLFAAKGIAEGDVTLSAAALGFIAGYNTDFLFSAMERLAAAVLPKVGIETMRQHAPMPLPAISGINVQEILTRLAAVTDEGERRALVGLLERLGQKL
ncbi:MAG TPA: hypothetical protein VED40_09395 [Azospirillaceae bacterium]|nr:hypothetical protein [Azospirillaceae bacterium]